MVSVNVNGMERTFGVWRICRITDISATSDRPDGQVIEAATIIAGLEAIVAHPRCRPLRAES
jgi:hypothetical protein